jgi:hypothetical protein
MACYRDNFGFLFFSSLSFVSPLILQPVCEITFYGAWMMFCVPSTFPLQNIHSYLKYPVAEHNNELHKVGILSWRVQQTDSVECLFNRAELQCSLLCKLLVKTYSFCTYSSHWWAMNGMNEWIRKEFLFCILSGQNNQCVQLRFIHATSVHIVAPCKPTHLNECNLGSRLGGE